MVSDCNTRKDSKLPEISLHFCKYLPWLYFFSFFFLFVTVWLQHIPVYAYMQSVSTFRQGDERRINTTHDHFGSHNSSWAAWRTMSFAIIITCICTLFFISDTENWMSFICPKYYFLIAAVDRQSCHSTELLMCIEYSLQNKCLLNILKYISFHVFVHRYNVC